MTSIINGGDGSGQHPSQSLLDLMTIYEWIWPLWGVSAAQRRLGSTHAAKSSRTWGLWNVWVRELFFAGPEEWRSQEFADYGQFVTIDEIIDQVDVYLRVQHNAMIVELR